MYRCSICSLVKGRDSEDDCCSRLVVLTCKAQVSPVGQASSPDFFFQFASFPWSFQQISRVGNTVSDNDHTMAFVCLLVYLLVAHYHELQGLNHQDQSLVPLLTLTSRQTSEKTSLIEGRGFRPKTRPQTSSRFVFSPAKNTNTRLCPTFFLYRALSFGLSHTSTSNISNS